MRCCRIIQIPSIGHSQGRTDITDQLLEVVISSIFLLNHQEGIPRAPLRVLMRLIQAMDTHSNINMRSIRVPLALGHKGPMKGVRNVIWAIYSGSNSSMRAFRSRSPFLKYSY